MIFSRVACAGAKNSAPSSASVQLGDLAEGQGAGRVGSLGAPSGAQTSIQ
jgi:hypothetical protein